MFDNNYNYCKIFILIFLHSNINSIKYLNLDKVYPIYF